MTAALPRASRTAVPPLRLSTPLPPGSALVRSAVNPIVRAALYLFVFSIPFEMSDRFAIPVEVPTATGALFLLATILQPSRAYRRIPGAVIWFMVYLWMFGLSTLVNRSDAPMAVLQLALMLLQLVLILWTASNLVRDPFVIRGVLLALVFACTIRAGMQVFGIGTSTHAEWTGGVRVTVLGQNPNLSAIILSAGLITALYIRPRVFGLAAAALMGVALIQTGSRGGLLCTAVGLMCLLWQGRTPWTRVRSVLLGCAALAVLAVGVWRSPMLRSRFQQAATQHTLAGREVIYPAALAMFTEKPFTGWGPVENQAEIAQRIGERRQDRRDAHNLLLELLSSTGLLGAIPFMIGLGLCVYGGWRARRGPLHMLPFALLMTVLTGSISGTWLASKVLWVALAVALGTGAVAQEQRRCVV
jgi:O-antigen ligase